MSSAKAFLKKNLQSVTFLYSSRVVTYKKGIILPFTTDIGRHVTIHKNHKIEIHFSEHRQVTNPLVHEFEHFLVSNEICEDATSQSVFEKRWG